MAHRRLNHPQGPNLPQNHHQKLTSRTQKLQQRFCLPKYFPLQALVKETDNISW
ncbi:hypothetical protein L208DRAFT_1410060 [Tricholoma matsutake]|nr:hypothetical protein L208DRAFT_1410060 [Tricholoma matsutake 945]